MSQTSLITRAPWTPYADGVHLKMAHLTKLHEGLSIILGVQRIAEGIKDFAIRVNVIDKAEKAKEVLLAQYAEEYFEDGSVLVKHPGIGFITTNSSYCPEKTRLFAAKVASIVTTKISVYKADAMISPLGRVDYVNREAILSMEMSQSQFAGLVASPGRNCYAATIREHRGEPVTFEGDLNEIRGQLVFNEAVNVTNGLDKWANKILSAFEEQINKGGVMSKRERDELAKNAHTLSAWTESNPGYYAKSLAEFSDQTTTDIKIEVMSAAQYKD